LTYGAVLIEKPGTLSYLGHITIADVQAARASEEHAKLVRAWAAKVWEAYTEQHELARAWIRAALGKDREIVGG
jgi:Family of unknown function (DUF5946)